MLKLKLQYLGHLMQRCDSLEKTLMLGKMEGKGEKGATEDERVGWHHRWTCPYNGHESEQTPGDSERSWGCKESDTTERLNKTTRQEVPVFEVHWGPLLSWAWLCTAVLAMPPLVPTQATQVRLPSGRLDCAFLRFHCSLAASLKSTPPSIASEAFPSQPSPCFPCPRLINVPNRPKSAAPSTPLTLPRPLCCRKHPSLLLPCSLPPPADLKAQGKHVLLWKVSSELPCPTCHQLTSH